MELFDELLQKIANKEPFSFSRWGDGEWASLLGIEGEDRRNTDGHIYFKDMGEALANVLKRKPQYYLGMQRFAREERYPSEIDQFIEQIDGHELKWVNADVFHHASIKGYFDKFFDTVEKRDCPVIIVGPKYLESIAYKFGGGNIVVVPEKNCWLERRQILHDVSHHLQRCDAAHASAIVLFVASMPSNYMIDELHKMFSGRHTLLDMGSVFDVYAGKCSRSYHKKVLERISVHGK